jgi:phage terminase large subunit-like protein
MVEGVSGVLSVARRRRHKVRWEPSIGRLRWPNGSEAQIFSGDNPDGLRGPEHDFAWCDELAKWGEAEAAWMNLQMGLRRGSRPRALVTTTPRPIDLLKRIREAESTVTTSGRTVENLNLDPRFVEAMMATYGGTRIGRQELDGELIEEIEGSLWPRELIELSRTAAPVCERIVVGVDPPAGVGPGCDACGIVVAGRRGDDLYVLADETVEGLTPEGWANRVAAAAARWGASVAVAEANNGGAMVASVLKAADSGLRVKLVHASKGKVARAEPVALRFEAGRAFLAGCFPMLEDQMAGMVAGGEYEGPGRSPDRADAMVWAMTELGETRSGLPRVRRL